MRFYDKLVLGYILVSALLIVGFCCDFNYADSFRQVIPRDWRDAYGEPAVVHCGGMCSFTENGYSYANPKFAMYSIPFILGFCVLLYYCPEKERGKESGV